MQQSIEQAEILVQALPYIRQYHGKTMVVKYGGSAMVDPALKEGVMRDIVLMRYVGMQPVLVHGGGHEINEVMEKTGKKPTFVGGLRVTDRETMDIVEMVLAGKTNKGIVALINRQGGRAVGLSGKDGNLFVAEKATSPAGDLGFVGDIVEIDVDIIQTLIREGYIPVISSVAVGRDGESYNVNADHAAGKLAAALKAAKLIVLSDVQGIYRDFGDESSLISELTIAQARGLAASGSVDSGMIPKVEACVTALDGGVERAHVINGTIPHALLIEIFTDKGIGTMIT